MFLITCLDIEHGVLATIGIAAGLLLVLLMSSAVQVFLYEVGRSVARWQRRRSAPQQTIIEQGLYAGAAD